MGTFTRGWNETTPTNLTEAHQIDDYMRYSAIDIAERLKAMFYGFTLGENSDEASVKFLNLKDQTSVEVPSVGYSRLYSATVENADEDDISELVHQNNEGVEVQLTADGKLNTALAALDSINQTMIELANDSYLVAANETDDDDVNLIKAGRNEADDADVALLPDLTRLASVAAPTENTQIPNKKYVDDGDKAIQSNRTQTGAFATGDTVIPLDDTIPQISEGTEFMTVAITPTNATHTLIIDVLATLYCANAYRIIGALFQDTTANALAAAVGYSATYGYVQVAIHYEMVAGTTEETTFRFRAGAELGTMAFNGSSSRIFGGVSISSLSVREIKD